MGPVSIEKAAAFYCSGIATLPLCVKKWALLSLAIYCTE
jgi:hypothetical protein